MKIWELIEIKEDSEFTYFMSNNYKGQIKIANEKVTNFREAIKAGRVDEDVWNKRLV